MGNKLDILKKDFIRIWGDVLEEEKDCNNQEYYNNWCDTWKEYIENTDLISESEKEEYNNAWNLNIDFRKLI